MPGPSPDLATLHRRVGRWQAVHRLGCIIMYLPAFFFVALMACSIPALANYTPSGPSQLGQTAPLTWADRFFMAIAIGAMASVPLAPVGMILRAVGSARLGAASANFADSFPDNPPDPPLHTGEFLGRWYVRTITPQAVTLEHRLAPPLVWSMAAIASAALLSGTFGALWTSTASGGFQPGTVAGAAVLTAVLAVWHILSFARWRVILNAGGPPHELRITLFLLLLPVTIRRPASGLAVLNEFCTVVLVGLAQPPVVSQHGVTIGRRAFLVKFDAGKAGYWHMSRLLDAIGLPAPHLARFEEAGDPAWRAHPGVPIQLIPILPGQTGASQ